MENSVWKDYSGLASRILAGGILIAAGTSKFLVSHDMLVWLLSGLGLPGFISGIAAYCLPYIEVLIGLLFAFGLFMPYPALVSVVFFALCEVVMLIAWLMGWPAVSAPYFGPAMTHRLSYEIFYNVLLILLVYPAAMFGRNLTLDYLIQKNLPEKIK